MEYQKSRKPGRLFTFSLLLLDVVAITSLYCLLVLMRHSQQFTEFFYPSALVVTIVTALATLALVGGYDRNTDMLGIRFMSEHLIASGIAFFISAVIIYAMTAYGADLHPPRASLAIIFLIFPVLSLFYRELLATRLYEDLGKRSLFVLGTGEQARQFYTQLRALQWPQRVSFFATEETEEEKKGTRLISDDPDSPPIQHDILQTLQQEKGAAESIVIAEDPNRIPRRLLERLVAINFQETEVQTLHTFFSRNWRIVPVSELPPLWGFDEAFRLNQSLTYARTKRFFDLVFALAMLLLVWPLLGIVAFVVLFESEGPAIFRQTRVGRDRRLFTLYKFRTMYQGSEEGDVYTREDDERVTKVGRFLRKFRLDELPQLWNVMQGNMSVIGPRSEWIKLVEKYEESIPHYHFRHLVKPGITGWAQVNYSYGASEKDTIEKLKYDLYYVRHFSFPLDLSITLKTLYILLGAKGQ